MNAARSVVQAKPATTSPGPSLPTTRGFGVPRPGGGRPLPRPLQAQMEGAFGHSFSDVRVHLGSLPQAVGADAFARGSDLFFKHTHYDPRSRQGQALIGHELAHVVQQREGRVAPSWSLAGMDINSDESLEREAELHGTKAAQSERNSPSGPMVRPAPAKPANPSAAGGVVQRMRVWRPFSTFSRRGMSTGGGGGGKDPHKAVDLGSSHQKDTKTSNVERLMDSLRAKADAIAKRNDLLRSRQLSGISTTPAFRYLNEQQEAAYKSPLEQKSGKSAVLEAISKMEQDPAHLRRVQEQHETGDTGYGESPLVSLGTDFMRLATTTDPWLSRITSQAPSLTLFDIPSHQLLSPNSQLSQNETEHLYMGGDLRENVRQVIPNPMQGGIPRLSTLPPSFVGALGGSGQLPLNVPRGVRTGSGGASPGREQQYAATLARLRRRLARKRGSDDSSSSSSK